MLARHSGLNPAIKVLGVDLQNPVHLREVETDPTVEGGDVPFERCADAERNDRDARGAAQPHDRRNLVVRVREHHDIGHAGVGESFAMTVLLAYRVSRHCACAIVAAKSAHHICNGVGIGPRNTRGIHIFLASEPR